LMYPGWTASVGGSPVVIDTQPQLKTMLIAVPVGEWRLTLTFVETAPRRLARWISLVALAVVALMLMAGRRGRHAGRDRRMMAG
ncbi:MAG TPA: hypothetical protein VJZ91_04960, partial [Blastocatellia bacterium]|nr:hypothetical protein [Blastocatellia bacterium]